VLTVIGTDGDDQIAIFESQGRVSEQHIVTGLVEGRLTWKYAVDTAFAGSEVRSIRVEAGAGDDDVWVANLSDEPFDVPLFIDGGAGHDVLGGGDAVDTIVGGAGDDWIVGNSTKDGFAADIWANSYRRYDRGFDIGSVLPVRDYSGAAITNNGTGDLLFADALPPVQAQPQSVPLTKQTATAAAAASADPLVTTPAVVLTPAPFAHTPNSLLEGDAAEVWGAAA
jgi:Ca2+-binding RTX toxin-like protein